MTAALLVSLLLRIITPKTKIGLRNRGEHIFSFVFTLTGETLICQSKETALSVVPGGLREDQHLGRARGGWK